MAILLDIVTGVFLLVGSVLILIGGWGLIRLKDVFARMHAAGMVDTLGLALILVGLMFQGGFTLVTFKLFLIFVLVLYTSPTVTHALARAVLAGGIEPVAERVRIDDGDDQSSS